MRGEGATTATRRLLLVDLEQPGALFELEVDEEKKIVKGMRRLEAPRP